MSPLACKSAKQQAMHACCQQAFVLHIAIWVLADCLFMLYNDSCDIAMLAHRMIETVIARFGGLHIAVNNAGVLRNSAAEDTTQEEWDQVFDVNTKGLFLCCQVTIVRPLRS